VSNLSILDFGRLDRTFGARTHPVESTYNYAGRLKTLKTWRDFGSDSGAAVTANNVPARKSETRFMA
jgi:hypothetical protein